MKEIVVAQAGWVLIGDCTDTSYGVELRNASVIRAWGTSNGLGEIALNGPTKSTILDPCGNVQIPLHAIIMRMVCKK